MRNARNGMAAPKRDGIEPRPERPVLLSILAETGMGDCFSMEWLLDRLEQRERMT